MYAMKQKQYLWILIIAVLLLAGCAQQQTAYIGTEKAKHVALEACGLSVNEIETMTTQFASRDGLDYYQVAFTAAGQSYQYDIDALTGMVIAETLSSIVPDDSSETDTDTSQPEKAGSAKANSQAPAILTMEEAKKVALTHAGVSDDQVTFEKSKLEKEHGTQVYELEFYIQNGQAYEYKIDAYSGSIISFDYDANYRRSLSSTGSQKSYIGEEKAQNIALAKVSGATSNHITKLKLDCDDDGYVYEVEIVYHNIEYDFDIDAYSGEILTWKFECNE